MTANKKNKIEETFKLLKLSTEENRRFFQNLALVEKKEDNKIFYKVANRTIVDEEEAQNARLE